MLRNQALRSSAQSGVENEQISSLHQLSQRRACTLLPQRSKLHLLNFVSDRAVGRIFAEAERQAHCLVLKHRLRVKILRGNETEP